MLARSVHVRVSRWLATLSLAVYASVGVFGHALHGLLPCADGSCSDRQFAAAEDHCCCCHHDAPASPAAANSGSDEDGLRLTRSGHDPDDCSLCTLLAKIKVGRLALYRAELVLAHSYHELPASGVTLPAGLDLAGAPRGPPLG
jgi:hypothetical protein